MKKLLWAWAIIFALLVMHLTDAKAGPIADELMRQNDVQIKIIDNHNSMIERQRLMRAEITSMKETIDALKESVTLANERAAQAEQMVKTLRIDTFNIKARMVQIEGELDYQQNEKKGWFR